MCIPPELIDLILSYTNIEEAFQFPQYLSKSTILQLVKPHDPKIWIYEEKTQYFRVAEPLIEFDWSDHNFYADQPIHINSIKQYRNKMNIKYLLKYQKLSSRFIETLIDTFTKDDWEIVSSNQYLSESFIIKYEAYLQIKLINYEFAPSEEYMERYKNILNWHSLNYIALPDEFVIKYHEHIYIFCLMQYNYVPADIVELHICRLEYDGNGSFYGQKLTEELFDKCYQL